MLITEDYRAQNTELHRTRADFGRNSSRWAEVVFCMCADMQSADVLDYGCGKAELNLCLPFGIQNYDPAIFKYSGTPQPADLVICTDVLEHIEPDCLSDVLADLRRCVKRTGILGIPLYKAERTLPDGRNAHLIVETWQWWKARVEEAEFEIVDSNNMPLKNHPTKFYLTLVVR